MSDDLVVRHVFGRRSVCGQLHFRRLRDTIAGLTGYEHVIPTHQGRGAENVLLSTIGRKGQAVVGNTHFDTTRAGHICAIGSRPVDLPVVEAGDASSDYPFKGNVDIEALEAFLQRTGGAEGVACVIVTVTNNAVGGSRCPRPICGRWRRGRRPRCTGLLGRCKVRGKRMVHSSSATRL